MIVLQAIRLDVHDRFQYRLDGPEDESVLFRDREEVSASLRRLGVADPDALIRHVETWGTIEIPTPKTS